MSKPKTKAIPNDYVDPRHRSSKDARNWYKGRVGVEHKPTWEATMRYNRGDIFPTYEECVCAACGRSMGLSRRRKVYQFGDIVKTLRQSTKASCEDVDLAAKVPIGTTAHIETNVGTPSVKMMSKIINTLTNRSFRIDIVVNNYARVALAIGEASLYEDGARVVAR